MKEDMWQTIVNLALTLKKDIQAWKKKDCKTLAIIGIFVEDSRVSLIHKAKFAKEAWEALIQYHEKVTLTSKVILLKQLCQKIFLKGQCMESHLSEIDNCLE